MKNGSGFCFVIEGQWVFCGRDLKMFTRHSQSRKNKAFTLIELLVVISIIALLLAILMPALTKVKDQAATSVCLSNLKQLYLLWFLYSGDYDGAMVSAHTGPTPWQNGNMGWVDWDNGLYDDNVTVMEDRQRELVRNGVLYPYCESENIYSCPRRLSGAVDERIFRTYGIVDSMNGWNPGGTRIGILKKASRIKRTTDRIVFLCEGYSTLSSWSIQIEDNDRWWGAFAPTYGNEYCPSHHQKGGTFSFADGRAEKHKWQDKRTLGWIPPVPTEDPFQPGSVDVRWMKKSIWGRNYDGRP